MFETVFNTYCIIHCKNKMICLINLQKLITVYILINLFIQNINKIIDFKIKVYNHLKYTKNIIKNLLLIDLQKTEFIEN